uniref:Polycystin cation channel PKD1/PKD2 domain-containing protein n=1 Tax=Panagrolaimus sp. ES5 TaxID=591445 RepID=A0AC34FF61_9BILA
MRRGGYNNLENARTATESSLFDLPNNMINYEERMTQLDDKDRESLQRLRRHLQFFFLDPMQKFKIRRQFPFKLALQIFKVLIVSLQLILFAQLRISHVDFLDETVTVMRHKFLRDWNHDNDAIVYPPESGRYAVFSSDQIIQHFSYIVTSYYNIGNESFASFSYDTLIPRPVSLKEDDHFAHIPPLSLCIERIADVSVVNDTYVFDVSEVTECFKLNFSHAEIDKIKENAMNIRQFLHNRNITFKAEDALIISRATLKFNLRTIHFSAASTDQKPECYLIKIEITFDNSRHSGQVFVRLNTLISYVNLCNGKVLQVGPYTADSILISVIDIAVLICCLASLLLCSRALIKAYLLQTETQRHFSRILGIELEWNDRWEFLNLWYVMIVINDAFIILGTIAKISIEFRDFDSSLFTLTGILLGLGVLLVYMGLFRYLGFFNQYNVLMLTLKKALPNILRFMVCTVILYLGFLLAGWVIIGPYSIKFRTLSQSSEALFSLLNGDDMFATFYTINDSNTTINIFGKVYIYVFVVLFIYVVLSLFIAIIMDAYEAVKEFCSEGLKVERSSLKEFLASAQPPDFSTAHVREEFAADQLLHLGTSFLLRSRQELAENIAELWHQFRNRSSPENSSAAAVPNTSFVNPLHSSNSRETAAVTSAVSMTQLSP